MTATKFTQITARERLQHCNEKTQSRKCSATKCIAKKHHSTLAFGIKHSKNTPRRHCRHHQTATGALNA